MAHCLVLLKLAMPGLENNKSQRSLNSAASPSPDPATQVLAPVVECGIVLLSWRRRVRRGKSCTDVDLCNKSFSGPGGPSVCTSNLSLNKSDLDKFKLTHPL